jgi:protein-L-isoaspartate(D-aspartate) O-methyltransferase
VNKKKPKFEHLSEVQRAWSSAQARRQAMPVKPMSFAPSPTEHLYSIMREGTLRSTSADWRVHPEILSKSRTQMVEALRRLRLGDEVVLAAMARVPRHVFVDEAFYLRAYDDDALPIGYEQTISHPSTVARMLGLLREGALKLGGRCERILEVGTGCGYQSAVLACFVRELYSIERIEPLYRLAQVNLAKVQSVLLSEPNLRFGDGLAGWPEVGSFDGIVMAAAGLAIPQDLLEQLRVGGVLVAPLVVNQRGAQQFQQLVRITRVSLREWRNEFLDAVHFVPLLQGTQSTQK